MSAMPAAMAVAGVALWIAAEADQTYQAQRAAMVEEQIRSRGVTDAAVLEAMRTVPRHRFVPDSQQSDAYADRPLPIGEGQTISQPFIVAHMTEALGVSRTDDVLEIGTGSGYQAAVLSRLARNVYTIEIVPELARRAAATLEALGYANVHVREGDGYAGWPERAPFARIMVTAAPARVPQPLVDQLATGGRMLIPIGGREQWMTVVDKTPKGVVERRTIPVVFVPFTRR
jgi:protein-L-isoaspartate(D-aspartate) O-methyltransferase